MSFKGLALWKRSEGDPAVVSRQVDRLMDLQKPGHFFTKNRCRWRVRPNLHKEPGATKDAARAARVQWDISSVWGPGSYQLTKSWNLKQFLEVKLDSSSVFFLRIAEIDQKFHTSGEGWLDCKHCVRSKMHRKKVHLINLLSSLVPRKLLHEIIRARGSMVPKAGCGIGG